MTVTKTNHMEDKRVLHTPTVHYLCSCKYVIVYKNYFYGKSKFYYIKYMQYLQRSKVHCQTSNNQ